MLVIPWSEEGADRKSIRSILPDALSVRKSCRKKDSNIIPSYQLPCSFHQSQCHDQDVLHQKRQNTASSPPIPTPSAKAPGVAICHRGALRDARDLIAVVPPRLAPASHRQGRTSRRATVASAEEVQSQEVDEESSMEGMDQESNSRIQKKEKYHTPNNTIYLPYCTIFVKCLMCVQHATFSFPHSIQPTSTETGSLPLHPSRSRPEAPGLGSPPGCACRSTCSLRGRRQRCWAAGALAKRKLRKE